MSKLVPVKLECSAVIQDIRYTIDGVGDLVGAVKLTFRPFVEDQDKMNRLQRPDCEVKLTIETNE